MRSIISSLVSRPMVSLTSPGEVVHADFFAFGIAAQGEVMGFAGFMAGAFGAGERGGGREGADAEGTGENPCGFHIVSFCGRDWKRRLNGSIGHIVESQLLVNESMTVRQRMKIDMTKMKSTVGQRVFLKD